MFSYDLSSRLRKKLDKLAKRDKVLAEIFLKKLNEVINHDAKSINTYKNLKAPQQEYKRIHLTDNFILIFRVNHRNKSILFVDILHWNYAYRE